MMYYILNVGYICCTDGMRIPMGISSKQK